MSYKQDLTSYCMEYAIGELHLQTFPFLMGLLTNRQHSRIFSIFTSMTSKPSLTIKFNTCAAPRMWKNFPFNKSESLKDNFSTNIFIISSLLEQLSRVTVNTFLSIFQSNKESINTSKRTFVCGGGT